MIGRHGCRLVWTTRSVVDKVAWFFYIMSEQKDIVKQCLRALAKQGNPECRVQFVPHPFRQSLLAQAGLQFNTYLRRTLNF